MLDASGLTQQAVQGDAETQQGAVAFEMLRADIVSCRIAPGSSVSEAELAARHGLGKAAIRRALIRLSERGWVQALARRLCGENRSRCATSARSSRCAA